MQQFNTSVVTWNEKIERKDTAITIFLFLFIIIFCSPIYWIFTLTTLIFVYSFGCQYYLSRFTNRFIFNSYISFMFYALIWNYISWSIIVPWTCCKCGMEHFLFQNLQMYVLVIWLMVHGCGGHIAKGHLQCK